jgi:hypothetical protein
LLPAAFVLLCVDLARDINAMIPMNDGDNNNSASRMRPLPPTSLSVSPVKPKRTLP